MKFKVTSIYTAETEAETKEQALENFRISPDDPNVIVEEIPEEKPQSITELMDILKQAQKELDSITESTEQKEQELFELESKKWEQICRYLISDIIPLLRMSDNHCHAVNILNGKNLYLYCDSGSCLSDAWYIGECGFGRFLLSEVRYAISVKFSGSESVPQYEEYCTTSYIIRNWDAIKPNLEKNVIELLSNDFKDRIERQKQLYEKYDSLLQKQKTDPLDEDQ